MVLCRVGFDPADGVVDVLDRFGKMELRRQTIVDAEPCKPGVGERFEYGRNEGALSSRVEPPAVDQDGGGKRSCAVRNMHVQEQRLASGS